MRHNDRKNNDLRSITLTRHYTKHAEGSVLVAFGDTKVLCTASISAGVPRFLKDSGQGWLTAEYGMLPRSTHSRMNREASRGKQSGRTLEIQRLIGRSLRCAVDLSKLGENTIYMDCDVIQADGGTRTASITGGCVALYDALHHLHTHGLEENGKTRIAGKALPEDARPDAFMQFIGSVSVGIFEGQPLLDLDYVEDSNAETDMNVVMTESSEYIEVQGTAEGKPFHEKELNDMLALAKSGITELVEKQKEAVL